MALVPYGHASPDNLIHSILHPNAADDEDADADPTSTIDPAALAAFRQQVKTWSALDVDVKRLQAAARERRAAQAQLASSILSFMQRYNIEDLNTDNGILRARMSQRRAPISSRSLHDRLKAAFATDPRSLEEIERAFQDRARVQKIALHRVR